MTDLFLYPGEANPNDVKLRDPSIPSASTPVFPDGSAQNPRGALFPIALRTFVLPLALLLIGKDQVYGAPAQVPTYVQANPTSATGSIGLRTWTQNLLATTLGVAPTPFAQTDWPVPRAAQPSLELRTDVDPSETWLLTDQVFGAPGQAPTYDWPTPRGPVFPSANRTWTLSLQQSTLPSVPLNQADWPVPRAASSLDLRTFALNLQGSTLQPSAAAPIVPIDWPNPRGAGYPIVLRTLTDGRKAYHVDTPAFALSEWPIPAGPRLAIELRSWTQNLLESTLGLPPVVVPFGLTDWPVPRGAIYPVSLRTLLDPRKTYAVDAPAFNQFDWPVPKGARAASDLRTFVLNLQQGTLGPAPKPFLLADWPVPKGAAHPLELRTFLNAVELQLLGKDTFYGAPGQPPPNYDWPVPKGAVRAITLRHSFNTPFISNIPSVLAQVPEFFIVQAQDRTFLVDAQGRFFFVDAAGHFEVAGVWVQAGWIQDDL